MWWQNHANLFKCCWARKEPWVVLFLSLAQWKLTQSSQSREKKRKTRRECIVLDKPDIKYLYKNVKFSLRRFFHSLMKNKPIWIRNSRILHWTFSIYVCIYIEHIHIMFIMTSKVCYSFYCFAKQWINYVSHGKTLANWKCELHRRTLSYIQQQQIISSILSSSITFLFLLKNVYTFIKDITRACRAFYYEFEWKWKEGPTQKRS